MMWNNVAVGPSAVQVAINLLLARHVPLEAHRACRPRSRLLAHRKNRSCCSCRPHHTVRSVKFSPDLSSSGVEMALKDCALIGHSVALTEQTGVMAMVVSDLDRSVVCAIFQRLRGVPKRASKPEMHRARGSRGFSRAKIGTFARVEPSRHQATGLPTVAPLHQPTIWVLSPAC